MRKPGCGDAGLIGHLLAKERSAVRTLRLMIRVAKRSVGHDRNLSEGLDGCRLCWIKGWGAPFDTSDLLTQTLNHIDVALGPDAMTNKTAARYFAADGGRRTNHLLRHDVSLKCD